MAACKRKSPIADAAEYLTSQTPLKKFRSTCLDPSEQSTTPPSSNLKTFACTYDGCDRAFDRPSKLEIHIRCHTNERPFVCSEFGCDKDFQRNEHLTRHLKDKHGIGDVQEFRCTYLLTNKDGHETQCGKVLPTSSKLRRHIDMHKDKEPLRCQESGCGKFFRKLETLQRHIRQDHLGEKAFLCQKNIIGVDGQSQECGKKFLTARHLKSHQSRNHGSCRFFCDICVDTSEIMREFKPECLNGSHDRRHCVGFLTYAEFQNHMKRSHPPVCTECGLQCESTRALRAHHDIVHMTAPERQKFKCTWPGCERGFTKLGNLNVHIQSIHVQKRDFVCGVFDLGASKKVSGWDSNGCGRALTTKASLEEHVRTQHLGLPSKLRKGIKPEPTDSPSTLTDMDEIITPPHPVSTERALELLTGHGYEDSRALECLVRTGQMRFMRKYDLAQHVKSWHQLRIDDIEDVITEHEAISGGKFWVGGTESGSDDFFTLPISLSDPPSLQMLSPLNLEKELGEVHGISGRTQSHSPSSTVLDPALEEL